MEGYLPLWIYLMSFPFLLMKEVSEYLNTVKVHGFILLRCQAVAPSMRISERLRPRRGLMINLLIRARSQHWS